MPNSIITTEFKPERFLRIGEVVRRVGVSRFTIWLWVKRREFRPSYSLNPTGGQAVAWRESEVEAWMNDRPLGPGTGNPKAWAARRAKHRARRAPGIDLQSIVTKSGMVRLAPLPAPERSAGEAENRSWMVDWSAPEKEPRQ